MRVPASSANLGPGFDVLAAALQLHLDVEVEETGHFEVVTDLDIARDRRNLCVRAFAALHPPDDFRFTINSDIPLSGGLGSSAAAIVAGLAAADHMYELDAPLFDLAAEIEGHPDNVAAALLGGFVICADGEQPQRFEAEQPVRVRGLLDPAQRPEQLPPQVREPRGKRRSGFHLGAGKLTIWGRLPGQGRLVQARIERL